jgi:hypothetical protein
MTKEPGKKVKVFIAIISITALAVIVAGGMLDYHQQVLDEKSGLWEPFTPIVKDDIIPLTFNHLFANQVFMPYPFSLPPPG